MVRPDPIPNSVVKRYSGDDNVVERLCENTSLPEILKPTLKVGFFVPIFSINVILKLLASLSRSGFQDLVFSFLLTLLAAKVPKTPSTGSRAKFFHSFIGE